VSTAGSGTDVWERAAAFRALHESGTFVMPNPWDAGSARLLAESGRPAAELRAEVREPPARGVGAV
jgi:hypothetical protein